MLLWYPSHWVATLTHTVQSDCLMEFDFDFTEINLELYQCDQLRIMATGISQ